jgi:predicted dienelactone hydrolase
MLAWTVTTAASVALAGGSGESASADSVYKSQPGPYEVGTARRVSLRDANRDKDLSIRVSWPDANGPFPVIVWSHGAGGSEDAYQPLVRHWVSHGYVVIQPTHADSLRYGIRSLDKLVRHWASRPADVSFVLDSLETIERKVPALAGLVDANAVGVGGHSFGAHTTMLVGGAKRVNWLGRAVRSYGDARPKVLVIVSPQGAGKGFSKDSFKSIDRPALFVTGTNDESPRHAGGAAWRLGAYHACAAKYKRLLFVHGAHHGFGGISGAKRYRNRGPDAPAQVAAVRSGALAMWDAWLKGQKRAKAFLDGEAMKRATEGKAEITDQEFTLPD